MFETSQSQKERRQAVTEFLATIYPPQTTSKQRHTKSRRGCYRCKSRRVKVSPSLKERNIIWSDLASVTKHILNVETAADLVFYAATAQRRASKVVHDRRLRHS